MFDEQEKQVFKAFVEESIKEKKRARRWGIFFKVTLLLLVVVGINYGAEDTGALLNSKENEDHVALIRLEGVILAEGGVSSEDINQRLREAFENEKSKAIILQINSPGGSAVQSSEINQEIKRLRKIHKDKPVYSVVSDICASGGMFIAVASDAIYANRASLIGSIGVIMSSFGLEELISKVGVERRLITGGDHKAMLDPFLPQKEGEVEHMQTLIDAVHRYFIKVVEEGRGNKLKGDRAQLYSGLIWDGEAAKKLGLIDGFGDAQYVAREIVKVDNLVEYEGEKDVFDFFQDLGSEVLFATLVKLTMFKAIH